MMCSNNIGPIVSYEDIAMSQHLRNVPEEESAHVYAPLKTEQAYHLRGMCAVT
jgi:hypothetical protein